MKITATQIADWAATTEARAGLPRLIRQLIHAAGVPTYADFPAGASVNLPGWDGKLRVDKHVNSWIPTGESFWELSCEEREVRKASQDYDKRTKETPDSVRMTATLVIVSARKWSGRDQWLKKKRAAGDWSEIRAYNADNIEQWLEQAPAVQLQFAEELGLSGPSVRSIRTYWEDWSQQVEPAISTDALFSDRENIREQLIAKVCEKLESDYSSPCTLRADSVEEAAAFVCAALLADPVLGVASLVVTQSDGWRFVEQNANLRVIAAARPEIATAPVRRKGLVVIVPYAAGDMEGSDRNVDLVLERPRIYEFEKALTSIGFDKADARRLAASTGRSWSVFRRRYSTNPAIRKPIWLDRPQAGILSTLCLLGGWQNSNIADQQVVTYLASRNYEDIERDLRYLARLDDAPIIQIGEIWKAKSPLELLDLFGNRITRSELERFFEILGQILTATDPQLDLPDENRYVAQLYGKVRPQSSLLLRSLCDSLVKLAVRGMQITALADANIEDRIAVFVRRLLEDADGIRWLSLSTFLPSLAEAAPDIFLRALEASLARPDAPVTRLLTETGESSFMGRCWYTDLLWALERLAWSPERLARVALILARLSRVEIKGNWGNSPKASLLDIFRSWFPQTAADVNQRIAILDILMANEPEVTFNLLEKLVDIRHDVATPSARPVWRGDDAGAGHGATCGERDRMRIAATDRLIVSSRDDPQRIAGLIDKTNIFDPARVAATLVLAEPFTESIAPDEAKESIRVALRSKLYWLRNYDSATGPALDNKLRPYEALYERLAPCDLVARHRWLFADDWPNLPMPVKEGNHQEHVAVLGDLRVKAIREIYADSGIAGIERLCATCPNQSTIGFTVGKMGLEMTDLADWIVEAGGDYSSPNPLAATIWGLLRSLTESSSRILIETVLQRGRQEGWAPEQTARFLTLARGERATWDIVAFCGNEVKKAYWVMTNVNLWMLLARDEIEFALRHLLEVGRPRSALQVCRFKPEEVDANLIAEILEGVISSQEPDRQLVDAWYLRKAIKWLEISGIVDLARLIRLEFALFPALHHGREDEAPEALYNAIMSDPRLFTEVLCMCYKPASEEHREHLTENMRAAAEIACQIIHYCRRQPGARKDGSIDRNVFLSFINEVRHLCRKADRFVICDQTIGQIIAHAPADPDETWPFEPARTILDRPEMEEMRHGFYIGVLNKRGMTSRGPDEGGDQERDLASTYHNYARAVRNFHPNVAATLDELARFYELEGRREDLDAQLERESY
jgi:hypothetical protein